jgi:hypothetical protein
MSPFFQGNDLDTFKSDLDDRRIYIIDYPLDDYVIRSRTEKQFFINFNNQFGLVETVYTRKMPGFDKEIYVIIFITRESRSNALDFYLSQEVLNRSIAVAKDIDALRLKIY